MHDITGNRNEVRKLLRTTVKQLKEKAPAPKKAGAKAMSTSKSPKAKAMKSAEDVWRKTLSRMGGKKGGAKAAGIGAGRGVTSGERAVKTGYAPRDQYIAVFQAAMDEYLDKAVGPATGGAPKSPKKASAASVKKGGKKKSVATLSDFYKGGKKAAKAGAKTTAADLFARYSNLDPGWVEVVTEKAKLLLKGKHEFIRHESLSDFCFEMNGDTTIAIVGDWGGGNAAAQAVAEQIEKLKPDHVIHLGDVYYAGTPREVKERFLKFWPAPSSPGRSFAVNSNHEMYSGGYGYFDHTLKKFKQPASYFSLVNDNWRFIGLDTGYDEHDLHPPQVDWLAGQFRDNAPKTILLSHHQLFSAYEETDSSKLRKKVAPFLNRVYGWIWGHEHLAVVYAEHEGINAICLGNGCFPYNLPTNKAKVPVKWIERRRSNDEDYRGGHTFALLKIKGPRIDIDFIDHRGEVGFTEKWE